MSAHHHHLGSACNRISFANFLIGLGCFWRDKTSARFGSLIVMFISAELSDAQLVLPLYERQAINEHPLSAGQLVVQLEHPEMETQASDSTKNRGPSLRISIIDSRTAAPYVEAANVVIVASWWQSAPRLVVRKKSSLSWTRDDTIG